MSDDLKKLRNLLFSINSSVHNNLKLIRQIKEEKKSDSEKQIIEMINNYNIFLESNISTITNSSNFNENNFEDKISYINSKYSNLKKKFFELERFLKIENEEIIKEEKFKINEKHNNEIQEFKKENFEIFKNLHKEYFNLNENISKIISENEYYKTQIEFIEEEIFEIKKTNELIK